MRAGLWLYLDLLARLPAGADTFEVEPAAVGRDMGLPEGTVRSWLGHLRKAGYLDAVRLNGKVRVTIEASPTPPTPSARPTAATHTLLHRRQDSSGHSGRPATTNALQAALNLYPDEVDQASPRRDAGRARDADPPLPNRALHLLTQTPCARHLTPSSPSIPDSANSATPCSTAAGSSTSGVLGLRRVPKEQRLADCPQTRRSWLRTHRPDVVVVEKTYRHPVPWLDQLHQLTRAARNARHPPGTPTFAMYSPQTVRADRRRQRQGEEARGRRRRRAPLPALRVYLTQDRRWKERYWQNMFDAVALALHHQAAQHPPSRGR